MKDNEKQTKPAETKNKRGFGLLGFRKKALSKDDIIKANSTFLNNMVNRAVKTLDKMEKSGRIPTKVAMRDGTVKEVNRAGIREFCEKFHKAHEDHIQRMREMNAKRKEAPKAAGSSRRKK